MIYWMTHLIWDIWFGQSYQSVRTRSNTVLSVCVFLFYLLISLVFTPQGLFFSGRCPTSFESVCINSTFCHSTFRWLYTQHLPVIITTVCVCVWSLFWFLVAVFAACLVIPHTLCADKLCVSLLCWLTAFSIFEYDVSAVKVKVIETHYACEYGPETLNTTRNIMGIHIQLCMNTHTDQTGCATEKLHTN